MLKIVHQPIPQGPLAESRNVPHNKNEVEGAAQDEDGDLLYPFTQVWSDGTRGPKLSPLERLEKLAALVTPPRVHQVRYAGCLAVHRKLRGTITPTPRQQGIETPGCSARCLCLGRFDADGGNPVSADSGWMSLSSSCCEN